MESNKFFFRGSCVMISFQDRVRSLIFAAVQCCRVDGIVLWNALSPVQGTILGSVGHMRVEQKFSDFVFCTSSCELSLQTTLIRDLRVAPGHVLNPIFLGGFPTKKFIWQPFSFSFVVL